MPEPRDRRRSLVLRLTKPVDPVYPGAVTPVAWSDDEALEEGEDVVRVITRRCVRMWSCRR